MKKTSLGILLALSALMTTPMTWAQTSSAESAAPPTLPAAPAPSPGDIEKLEQYIGELYQNVGNFMISQNFQPISDLQQMISTNTQTVDNLNGQTLSPIAAAAEQAKQQTTNNLINSLQQFPYAILQGDPKTGPTLTTAEGSSFAKYMEANKSKSLASDPNFPFTEASDTLYAPKQTVMENVTNTQTLKEDNLWLLKPTTLNNDNFNFAALITPTGYSQTEAAAAKQFVVYAAQSTQDLTSTLTNCKQAPCGIAQLSSNLPALLAIKKDPIYTEFALTIRTILAIRSMSINILNQLIAERTPMPGLAAAAGFNQNDKASLTPTEQKELKENKASPLQVAAYQANHRIQDPKWYQSIQNASPADVQRNILITLAEIEHQNYEAHLDRERILAALTASNLMSNMGTINTVLDQGGSKLNTEIIDVINNLKPAAVQKPGQQPMPHETNKPKIQGT